MSMDEDNVKQIVAKLAEKGEQVTVEQCLILLSNNNNLNHS